MTPILSLFLVHPRESRLTWRHDDIGPPWLDRRAQFKLPLAPFGGEDPDADGCAQGHPTGGGDTWLRRTRPRVANAAESGEAAAQVGADAG